MRYKSTDSGCIYAKFNTSDTVTMTVYDSAGNTESLTSATMTEIGSTGWFRWLLSNIVNASSTHDDYLVIADNTSYQQSWHVGIGGYPDEVSAIETDTQDIQSRLPAALVSGKMDSDMVAVSGDTTAADNIEATYDGTGYNDDFAPAQQHQLSQIVSTGAAINVVAESVTVTKGTEASGTYADTATLNATYHQISDDTGLTDIYYQFDVGSDGVPTSTFFTGRSMSQNDDLTIYAYNWSGVSWDQIGTIGGTAVAVDEAITSTLFTNHVGTGANIGKVRIRFEGSGLTSANLYVDQVYVSYAVVYRSVGYANGAIWVDTVNGAAGTTEFINGVADNPVDSWADALTLSASLGIKRFHIVNGSTITLSANSDNYTLMGGEWTLALGGQSCDDAVFIGAHVTGTCTGDEVIFINCDLAAGGGTLTTAGIEAHRCGIGGSIAFTAANTYYFDQCYSQIAGTSTPDIDTGAAVANVNLNMRHYSGGVEVKNLGATGTDNMSLEGDGQLIINANCVGGTIAIRGNFTVTDNASGAVTLSDDARFTISELVDAVYDEAASGHVTVGTFGKYINDLFQIGTGRWKIILDGSDYKWIFYEDDGSTPLYTFNLKDQDGNPSLNNVRDRDPI